MAPKHGPRGNAKKKAAPPAVPDSDHIVFTNNTSSQSSTKKKATQDTQETEPPPPRPDAKKIIGGASWTGKLPGTLLSELCQRETWNKPDYSMRQVPGGGHRSTVKLSATHPKTKNLTVVTFQLPSTHAHLSDQPTPLEARHFAAAYTLFRVSSMKNIHMMLPPQYRDLWKGDFADLKKEDVDAGRGWRYDADPFAAEVKRQQQISEHLEKKAAQAAKSASAAPSLSMSLPGRAGRPNRAWERAPKVEMGRRIRADIEELVKSNMIWNPYKASLSDAERASIVNELTSLHFRRNHVEEALQQCKDREETLEWLLIHIPEDDLPPWAFPEGYSAGITLASGDPRKEKKLKDLALAGYSADDCARALRENDGDEALAAEALQDQLMPALSAEANGNYQQADHHVWNDEMASLEAIFADRYSRSWDGMCTINSDQHTIPTTFSFRRPRRGYPANVPIIAIQASLPAHVRLSATRQALLFAESLLGDAMIYNLVEWLETNLPNIVENPGPLRDVTLSDAQPNHDLHAYPIKGGAKEESGWSGQNLTIQISRNVQGQLSGARQSSRNPGQPVNNTSYVPPHMLRQRQSLPAWTKQEAIIEAVGAHQCVIISGETGSGKSTQSVQFVLDHLRSLGSVANIVCTQPRRVAALSLADRVSSERGSKVGEEVGFVIRGESKLSASTRLTFMTTGVLLRRLSSTKASARQSDSSKDMLQALSDITHIFVDEVHERNLDTDFLLALLRDVLKLRTDLKVILMSATLDATTFQDYFGGSNKVGQVHIPGRTFPVTDLYLDDVVRITGKTVNDSEDGDTWDATREQSEGQRIRSLGMGINYELVANLVWHIDEQLRNENNPGGILIFLPGTLEIDRTLRALRGSQLHGLPLHASLTSAEQRLVFQPPPAGKRKVVAATNVAETSITIDDIVAVIDTGRVKETNYDPNDSIVRLEEVWASQAACKQRRGRAGRVQAGICYKLFTRNIEQKMAVRPEPEIRRVPLEQLCLSVKATGSDRDVAQFLRGTLTPPEDQAIDVAVKLLHRIGALDNHQLTALGHYLAMIPVDLRCAKLLVYGSIFSCTEACITIAAILTSRSPFVSPRDKREEAKAARSAFSNGHGDLILDMAAFDAWSGQSSILRYRDVQRWCSDNFVSQQTLRDIASTRSQLVTSLKDASLVPWDYRTGTSTYEALNAKVNDMPLLRALIASALNPQIARIEFPDKKFAASIAGAVELDPEAKTIKYFSQDNGRVFVHPSSTLFDAQTFSGSAAYVSYFSKMATSKTFVRNLTRKCFLVYYFSQMMA